MGARTAMSNWTPPIFSTPTTPRIRPLLIFPVEGEYAEWFEQRRVKSVRSASGTFTFMGVLTTAWRLYGHVLEGYPLSTGIVIAPWSWWLLEYKIRTQHKVERLGRVMYWAFFEPTQQGVAIKHEGVIPDWLDLDGYHPLPLQSLDDDEGQVPHAT